MKRILRINAGGPARRRRGVLFSTLMLVVLMLSVTAPGASAARLWCRTDPLLLIDGRLVDISVSGPLLAPLKVTGPTRIELFVPQGVNAQVLLSDLGFGRGYRTTIKEVPYLERTKHYTEIQFRVYVPSRDRSMPVKVDVSEGLLGLLSPTSVQGTANTWITMPLAIARY